jgi:hypothetical protein
MSHFVSNESSRGSFMAHSIQIHSHHPNRGPEHKLDKLLRLSLVLKKIRFKEEPTAYILQTEFTYATPWAPPSERQ